MTKQEFLNVLRDKLIGLPVESIESAIAYYDEIIDDSIEDGMSEEEAVKSLGNISDIAYNVIADTPLKKIIENKKINKPKVNGWKLAVIVLTTPIWLPVLFVFAVVSFFVSLAIILTILTVFIGLFGLTMLGLMLLVYAIFYYVKVSLTNGVFILGLSIICIGLGIITFEFAKKLFVLLRVLLKKAIDKIKNAAVKKG